MADELLMRVVSAIVASVDPATLDHVLARARGATVTTDAVVPSSIARDELAGRLLLVDLLDDDILGAKVGERPYPLRLLLTHLGETLNDPSGAGFELACALNVFFRVEMEDEAKMRLGVEASRLYYRFVRQKAIDPATVTSLSPLVASLLSGQLERLAFESVDHQKVFDGALHERAPGSDGTSAALVEALTFLCRVSKTGMVRVRAAVRT